MEIRCSKCEFLGVATEVRPVDGGVGLVCSQCGHTNVVAMEDEQGRDGAVPGASEDEKKDEGSAAEEFVRRSMKRLMPEPGEGQRCRKCLHLFEDEHSDHCVQCGLSVAQAERFDDGEAPWEKVEAEQQEALAQGRQLWSAVLDDDREERIETFVDFVTANGLVDFGIRTLQQFLVDHRDDPEAVEGLRRLAKTLFVTVEVAQGRATTEAKAFNEDVKRFRSNMLIGALVFWTVILLLFSWLFWDKF